MFPYTQEVRAVLAIVIFSGAIFLLHAYRVPLHELAATIQGATQDLLASIIRSPKTLPDLHNRFSLAQQGAGKVRVLLVPGHEPDYGGSEFGALKERDLAVTLSGYLSEYLTATKLYEVTVVRDKAAWNPLFASYFEREWNAIPAWRRENAQSLERLVAVGTLKEVKPVVVHNTARSDVAIRLHGINKWANEQSIDIVIHVHFNDYPHANTSVAGKYSGFVLYVPESQYYNSTTTRAVAASITKRFGAYSPTSNMPQESDGIVGSPDLIAIGSNNSADAASMLIEYGYLYEPQFTNPAVRDSAVRDLAYQTYLGIQDFFNPKINNDPRGYGTVTLPYSWPVGTELAQLNARDVFALQSALLKQGFYPPPYKTKNDCPRTGTFGPCTRESLSSFQAYYKIVGNKKTLDQKTVELLESAPGQTTAR